MKIAACAAYNESNWNSNRQLLPLHLPEDKEGEVYVSCSMIEVADPRKINPLSPKPWEASMSAPHPHPGHPPGVQVLRILQACPPPPPVEIWTSRGKPSH